jgi:hypothetical protein
MEAMAEIRKRDHKLIPDEPAHGKRHPYPRGRYGWVAYARGSRYRPRPEFEETDDTPACGELTVCSHCETDMYPEIVGIFSTYADMIMSLRNNQWDRPLWDYVYKKVYITNCRAD